MAGQHSARPVSGEIMAVSFNCLPRRSAEARRTRTATPSSSYCRSFRHGLDDVSPAIVAA